MAARDSREAGGGKADNRQPTSDRCLQIMLKIL